MNIGIVVYSQTGHTLSVAMQLKEKLSAAGHAVNLERVEAAGPVGPAETGIRLKTKPEIDAYDGVVFGSPVIGGAMPPAMSSYMAQITSLQDKKVACLVTHFFRPAWGADQTISQMTDICESKGATVCGAGNVRWFQLRRKCKIAEVVEDMSRLF
jgi:menaquinone-dependent protoporphyrinogen IX oxidase